MLLAVKRKKWEKLLKESGEDPDSESDDYHVDIDVPSVEVESNDNNFCSSNDRTGSIIPNLMKILMTIQVILIG